jgi:protoporphyrinogen IX oxidase
MLWIKSFLIVFVNLVMVPMVPRESAAERDRLLLMARKLLRLTTLIAVLKPF